MRRCRADASLHVVFHGCLCRRRAKDSEILPANNALLCPKTWLPRGAASSESISFHSSGTANMSSSIMSQCTCACAFRALRHDRAVYQHRNCVRSCSRQLCATRLRTLHGHRFVTSICCKICRHGVLNRQRMTFHLQSSDPPPSEKLGQ